MKWRTSHVYIVEFVSPGTGPTLSSIQMICAEFIPRDVVACFFFFVLFVSRNKYKSFFLPTSNARTLLRVIDLRNFASK
jgi:hypothetical protein